MRKITFLFILLCIYGKIIAQPELPQIIPVSPEASALAKYINYPVNYSTGLVNITIPLYEIKVGDLSVPIYLTYHSSGLKVREECGWIGLGWTLNAEPSISRSIQGLPDENGYIRNVKDNLNIQYVYTKALLEGTVEETPDEFYYKLLDKSGGFLFHRNNMSSPAEGYRIIPHPYEPVKISCNVSSTGAYAPMNFFSLTDENGVMYEFEEKEYFRGGYEAPTQWKASKIKSSKTNEEITFSYNSGKAKSILSNVDAVNIHDYLEYDNTKVCHDIFTVYMGMYLNGYSSMHEYTQTGIRETIAHEHLIKPSAGIAGSTISKKLNRITFSGGYVLFVTNAEDKLETISVFDNSNNLIRKILFNRSKFSSEFDTYRLDNIHILDKNSTVEKYIFEYNSGVPNRKLTKDIDHWGYYNGANNDIDKTLVPRQMIDVNYNQCRYQIEIGNALREPSVYYTQCGMLKSITYPTGGKTTFTYEGNKYRKSYYSSELVHSGGLRVSSIKDYDSNGDLSLQRYFKYGRNECGGGIARHNVTLEDYMSEQRLVSSSGINRLRTYNSNAIPDLFYSEGSPVVYDFVTEYRTGAGKTVYKYNYDFNHESQQTSPDPMRRVHINRRDSWQWGQLIEQIDYKYENGIYIAVKKKNWDWSQELFKDTKTQAGKIIQITLGNGDFSVSDTYYVSDNIWSGCKRLKKETTVDLFPSGNITTFVQSYFDESKDHMLPVKTETGNSKGSLITQEYKYTEDIVCSGIAEQARQKLLNENRLATVIEQSKKEGNVTEKTLNEYKIFSSNLALPNLIKTNTGSNSEYENRIIFNSYTNKGNITSMASASGPELVFLWGYNNQYPIAKIENSSYQQVVTALQSQGLTVEQLGGSNLPDIAKVNALRTLLPAAHVYTYTYKPLVGMVSETDPNGIVTEYDYDSFGRLIKVLDMDRNILKQFEYRYKNQ